MNDPGWAGTAQKHTMWLHVIPTLLNWIVVLIKAIIVPPANSVSTNNNYLWSPHNEYDYVHDCWLAANWACPGGHPIPFCALLSRETHLSGLWRYQNGGCAGSAGPGGRGLPEASTASSPCSLFTLTFSSHHHALQPSDDVLRPSPQFSF